MSVRLVLDISMGVFSPYLPVIARGLGVSVAVMGILLSVRSAFGLTSPIFGALIDRLGARHILVAGLALLAAGTGILAVGPAFALAALAFGLIGLGQVMFFPALQAYISNQVALHADWSVPVAPGDYQVCNSIWLLDDFTEHNGATRVAPGTHRSGSLPRAAMPDPKAAHPRCRTS